MLFCGVAHTRATCGGSHDGAFTESTPFTSSSGTSPGGVLLSLHSSDPCLPGAIRTTWKTVASRVPDHGSNGDALRYVSSYLAFSSKRWESSLRKYRLAADSAWTQNPRTGWLFGGKLVAVS